uniref:Uncharacterized protein n=1 Tax=Anguilla anguilla TaxID=7936 RepID=A0A0E9X2N2_ANGAN
MPLPQTGCALAALQESNSPTLAQTSPVQIPPATLPFKIYTVLHNYSPSHHDNTTPQKLYKRHSKSVRHTIFSFERISLPFSTVQNLGRFNYRFKIY